MAKSYLTWWISRTTNAGKLSSTILLSGITNQRHHWKSNFHGIVGNWKHLDLIVMHNRSFILWIFIVCVCKRSFISTFEMVLNLYMSFDPLLYCINHTVRLSLAQPWFLVGALVPRTMQLIVIKESRRSLASGVLSQRCNCCCHYW